MVEIVEDLTIYRDGDDLSWRAYPRPTIGYVPAAPDARVESPTPPCVGTGIDFVPQTSPEEYVLLKTARAICSRCPIFVECLDAALCGDEYGVWAATTREQRRRWWPEEEDRRYARSWARQFIAEASA